MYTEIKYLNLLSSRLEKFKRKKEYLWNFRCPICGDSQTNKNKARGFVFPMKRSGGGSGLVYKCHNCGSSMTLPHLIEKLDTQLYKEYLFEKFSENNTPKVTISEKKVKKIVSQKPTFDVEVLDKLIPIDKLNNNHPAKEYLLNRKLPTEDLYYTDQFKEWTNTVKPETFEDTSVDEPRIIIPLIDTKGQTFGYQGRSLSSTTELRYITILLDDTKPKIFGLNRVNFNEIIYITEGPFDSLLIDNAIAMAGSDISDCVELHDRRCVYVYDNEPRNRAITDRMSKLIAEGNSVVIWPPLVSENYKDINDMYLAGYDVKSLVKNSTHSGLTATLLLNQWKK
ncbi:DNA primase [Synechococcus phage S-CRM01]|uniref:DNA primase n=1 Tax=Synechococcus phage S-CRM01 TaxID=1026955 RepID=UPI000209E3B4|nr:DNA primase [Synechococcus phage S-CRM01]AEC53066.1 DNA primase [Synechococcus phage S-CRM01]